MIEISCNGCSKTIRLNYSTHEKLKGRKDIFCSKECSYLYYSKTNTYKEVLDNEQERILKKAKAILYAEMKVYGTDKHGLSYEQLEEIIKK